MAFVFNWHKIPTKLRVGDSPDEEMTLFRGYNPEIEDPSNGFSSAAYSAGAIDKINDVARTVERLDIARLVGYISAHTTPGIWQERGLTPFISATPDKEIAERRYARRPGEQVATFAVPVSQIVTDGFFDYETLVLGRIESEQVLAVELAK